jgi:hypothetical protein
MSELYSPWTDHKENTASYSSTVAWRHPRNRPSKKTTVPSIVALLSNGCKQAFPLLTVDLQRARHNIENSSFYNIYKSSVSPGSSKQIIPILFTLCYNGSLVNWTVVILTAAKFKPFIFSVSGSRLFVLMVLYDLCLWPAQFCCIIIYIWQVRQSQRYYTTGGLPPVSSSWRQATEAHDQSLFFSATECLRS